MPLQKYKRGKFWWLKGTIDGNRIHRSTDQIHEDLAEIERQRIERELHVAQVRARQWNFRDAVALHIGNGGNLDDLSPLLERFDTIPCDEIVPQDIYQFALELFPGDAMRDRNQRVIERMAMVLETSFIAGKCQRKSVTPLNYMQWKHFRP